MPAILTATVIRWRVERPERVERVERVEEREPPEVAYDDEEEVRLYTSDGSERPGAGDVMIIAKYILDSAKRARTAGEDVGRVVGELLEAARDGLLEVTDLQRREVQPPPMPPKRRGRD